jgi:hypothetical protein
MKTALIILLVVGILMFVVSLIFAALIFKGLRNFWREGQNRARENRRRVAGWGGALTTSGVSDTLKDIFGDALKDEDLTPEEHKKKYGW